MLAPEEVAMHARLTRLLMTVSLAVVSAAPLSSQVAAPTNVTAVAGRGTVTVSWTGIRNREVTYRVLRALDQKARGEDLTRPLTFDVASFVDATVAAGITYFYQVIAVYGDGSEGASAAVQYPASAAAVATISTIAPVTSAASTPTVTRQGGRSAPTTLAPTVPLRASTLTATGQYNRVTLSWQPVITNAGPITYEVRRAVVDPATPGAPIGYLTWAPTQQPGGGFMVKDLAADLHLPTWYRVTTKSSSQGSIDSPWYRYDPTPHRGVDSIMGGYWREMVSPNGDGTNLMGIWTGCVRWSAASGAGKHWVRIRTASGPWVNVPVTVNDPNTGQVLVSKVSTVFSTSGGGGGGNNPYSVLFTPLENGFPLEVQVGGMFGSGQQNVMWGPFLSDLNHLQPMYVGFTKLTVPLNLVTCQP